MSYCVNCGVELEPSQRACPLCGVEVVNPREPVDPARRRPYSNKVAMIQARVERRYAGFITTVLMALGACVCVMADLVYNGGFSWSAIVLGSLTFLWVLIVMPMCFPTLHPVLLVGMDACALLLLLYLINLMDRSTDWYQTLALPQVAITGGLALFSALAWRSKHVRGWQRYGVISAAIGLSLMALEALLDHFNHLTVSLDWSWFVVIPSFALTVVFFLLERKQEVKEAILKRLRV